MKILHFVSNHGLGPLFRSRILASRVAAAAGAFTGSKIDYVLVVGEEAPAEEGPCGSRALRALPRRGEVVNRKGAWDARDYPAEFSSYIRRARGRIREVFAAHPGADLVISDQLPEALFDCGGRAGKVYVTDHLGEIQALGAEFDHLEELLGVECVVFADTRSYLQSTAPGFLRAYAGRFLVSGPIIDFDGAAEGSKSDARAALGLPPDGLCVLLTGAPPQKAVGLLERFEAPTHCLLGFNASMPVHLPGPVRITAPGLVDNRTYLKAIKACDLMIAVGGRQALYEAICCGTPIVSFPRTGHEKEEAITAHLSSLGVLIDGRRDEAEASLPSRIDSTTAALAPYRECELDVRGLDRSVATIVEELLCGTAGG